MADMIRDGKTYVGMAHFAGSGPDGETCRTCRNWGGKGRPKRDHWGALYDRPCTEYVRLTRRKGQPIPQHAPACKWFVKAPKAVPEFVSNGRDE